jgi:hypothetical protein
MKNENKKDHAASRWRGVLTDVQFWIPAAVLLAGLLVLRWIQ